MTRAAVGTFPRTAFVVLEAPLANVHILGHCSLRVVATLMRVDADATGREGHDERDADRSEHTHILLPHFGIEPSSRCELTVTLLITCYSRGYGSLADVDEAASATHDEIEIASAMYAWRTAN